MSLFEKFFVYWRTVNKLEFRQILYYIVNRSFLKNFKIYPKYNFKIREKNRLSKPFFYLKKCNFDSSFYFTFLNIKKKIFIEKNWNPEGFDKLWLYNLHYFDYLISKECLNDKNLSIEIINKWIKSNSPYKGNGWEPYTISIRLVNWIKFFLIIGEKPSDLIITSLNKQFSFLSKNLEFHILGNHLLANIKAMIFFIFYFDTSNLKKKNKKIFLLLNSQINTQILNDGYHYELSPFYHSIIIEDLLDIVNLGKIYKYDFKIDKRLILKMINALKLTTHPDGNLANFNDTHHKVKYAFKALENYYLKIFSNQIKLNNEQKINSLNNSGFYRYNNKYFDIICFFGSITSHHQPGHSHACTLSFELSSKSKTIFRNLGTSTYNNNSQRLKDRSSESYNMLQVGKINSNEVWDSFRVGNRAKVFDFKTKKIKNYFMIEASHDGFKKENIIHKRRIEISDKTFKVFDKLIGFTKKQTSIRFYLNYDIKINKINNNLLELFSENQKIAIIKSKNYIYIKKSKQSLDFNNYQNNILLMVILKNDNENDFTLEYI